jgi:hypothetical protein
MGRSLSTKIVYGYDIGSQNGDDGWKFEEYDASEYRIKWPEWVQLDDEDSDGEPDDFISQAKDRLLSELTSFKDSDDWDSSDQKVSRAYYDQKHAAKKKLGIDFEIYGVGDYTEWVMGFEMGHDYDGIGELDPALIATLLNPLNMADMDYRLREAVRVLQLRPKGQIAPRLLLLASYF